MSATQDLIAAALRLAALAERNTDCRDEWQEAIDSVREACARAMVQPDIAEVERLVQNLESCAKWAAVEVEDENHRRIWLEEQMVTRAALLDAVRAIVAERDQFRDAAKMVQPVGEVPMPEPDIMHTGTDGELYGYWNEYQMIHYGDACKEAGYAAGVAKADETRRLYNELLHQVGMKYPGETRHETAIRYLRLAEIHVYGPAVAALRGEVKP